MIAASTVLLLVGCTPEAAPTVLPTAAVEQAGSTDFEADEFVVGVREWNLGETLAWNARDFTIDPLTDSVSAERIDELYGQLSAYATRDLHPDVFVGPLIWAPLSVTVTGATAEIEACVASQDRKVEEGNEETTFELTDGELQVWMVEKSTGGLFEITDTAGSAESCDASAAEVVTFDPAPTRPDAIAESDIRPPA